MTLRSLLSLLFMAALSFTSPAQDEAHKNLLKRTALSIHKAQKHMLHSGKTDMGGRLAQAVLLQSYAVQLFKEKKTDQASCVSLQARDAVLSIFKKINEKKEFKPLATEDEKKLAGGCTSGEALLKEGRKAVKNISDKDNDYLDPNSLNETNIDIK